MTAAPDAPSLSDVVDLLHGWFPPDTADEWDAVGLVLGVPDQPVRRILFAVDPVLPVAEEAADWGADLLVVHHPLFLRPVHGVPATTPKGRTLHRLTTAGCGLLTAHTNADRAAHGVSAALAGALGLTDTEPLVAEDGGRGIGRVGLVPETTLGDFADAVTAALPGHGTGGPGGGRRGAAGATRGRGGGRGRLPARPGRLHRRRRLPHQRPAPSSGAGVPGEGRARRWSTSRTGPRSGPGCRWCGPRSTTRWGIRWRPG